MALTCEVLTQTKASSNPDQAAAICEFAKTIKRLNLDEKYPEEIQGLTRVLVAGWIAHWKNEKRKRRTLIQFLQDYKVGLATIVPIDKFETLVKAGAKAGQHPQAVAAVVSASEFGKLVFGYAATGALGCISESS